MGNCASTETPVVQESNTTEKKPVTTSKQDQDGEETTPAKKDGTQKANTPDQPDQDQDGEVHQVDKGDDDDTKPEPSQSRIAAVDLSEDAPRPTTASPHALPRTIEDESFNINETKQQLAPFRNGVAKVLYQRRIWSRLSAELDAAEEMDLLNKVDFHRTLEHGITSESSNLDDEGNNNNNAEVSRATATPTRSKAINSPKLTTKERMQKRRAYQRYCQQYEIDDIDTYPEHELASDDFLWNLTQVQHRCRKINPQHPHGKGAIVNNKGRQFDIADIPELTDSTKITEEWVQKLLSEFRHGKILSHQNAFVLTKRAIKSLMNEKNCPSLKIPRDATCTVVGDLHGQLDDLLMIFREAGTPSKEHHILFNGDFVDRGIYSTEIIWVLFAYRVLYPDFVHLNRGNHECSDMNAFDGFEKECVLKYSKELYNYVNHAFACVPVAHVVTIGQQRVFVVHAGLSFEDITVEEINAENRFLTSFAANTILQDLLWSDPFDGVGRQLSRRGAGCQFGIDVVQNFLVKNNVHLIIRSHECEDNGFALWFNNRLYTIFSASNYCLGKGSRVTLDNGLSTTIENISQSNSTTLLSYDPMTKQTTYQPTHHQYRINTGIKECIEVVLNNGKKITCTPDHIFRVRTLLPNSTTEYTDIEVPASQLGPEHQIIIAPEGVLDVVETDQDIISWSYPLSSHYPALSFNNTTDRSRALSFARLMGLIYAYNQYQNGFIKMPFSHHLDLTSIYADIKSVFGTLDGVDANDNEIIMNNQNMVNVIVDAMSYIMSFDNQNQSITPITSPLDSIFPHMIYNNSNTPKSFIREFLASFFGLTLDVPHYSPSTQTFTNLTFNWKSIPNKFGDQNQAALCITQAMAKLLTRFDINIPTPPSDSITTSSINNTTQFTISVQLDNTMLNTFTETIGYRYSVDKWAKLNIVNNYYQSMALNPTTITDYLTQSSAMDIMLNGVGKQFSGIPTWTTTVNTINNIGQSETFDLSIKQTNLFVANGAIVHNCGDSGNYGAFCVLSSAPSPQIRVFSAKQQVAKYSERQIHVRQSLLSKLLVRIASRICDIETTLNDIASKRGTPGFVPPFAWSFALMTALGLDAAYLPIATKLGVNVNSEGRVVDAGLLTQEHSNHTYASPYSDDDRATRQLTFIKTAGQVASEDDNGKVLIDVTAWVNKFKPKDLDNHDLQGRIASLLYDTTSPFLSGLESLFYHFDTNGDGFISTEELTIGLTKIWDAMSLDKEILTPESIDELIEKVDLDADGEIDYNEFFKAFAYGSLDIQDTAVTEF